MIARAGLALPKALTAKVNYFGMTEFLEAIRPVLTASKTPRLALIFAKISRRPIGIMKSIMTRRKLVLRRHERAAPPQRKARLRFA